MFLGREDCSGLERKQTWGTCLPMMAIHDIRGGWDIMRKLW